MGKISQEITEYFEKYEPEKIERLETIRALIHTKNSEVNEKMWTRVPCFYIGKESIVIRVFGDHINFIADTVTEYKNELSQYKITPRGMLQIFDDQDLPLDTLKKIISDLWNARN